MNAANVRWYETSTGNHQGLVVEEVTGRNVAVCYDKADAPLIAAAPELLAALVSVRDRWLNVKMGRYTHRDIKEELAAMEAAIAKAKGTTK